MGVVLGHPGEHQPANTAFDHDNINLQVKMFFFRRFIFIIFKYFSEAGFPAGDQEEKHPKVTDTGWFSTLVSLFNLFPQMKKKSMQKPSKKMDKMYKKMLEKQRLQKKREKYEKLHKAKKQQVP